MQKKVIVNNCLECPHAIPSMKGAQRIFCGIDDNDRVVEDGSEEFPTWCSLDDA